jgi:dephospho-CoA kinase
MQIFGLTGGLAAGKSTVAARFREAGIPIIDADVLAREVVAPGTPALAEIGARFGARAIDSSGALDRAWLAARVFDTPAELAALNAIVHPRVAARLQEHCETLERAGHALIGYEVPLLFENQLETKYQPVVVVTAPEELQITRAMQRNGWTREHTQRRINSQMSLAEKCARADFVIDTQGDLEDTHRQVDAVARALRRHSVR